MYLFEEFAQRARMHLRRKGVVHPGEVLRSDFLAVFGITQNRLAVLIGVPPRRINEIVKGLRGVSIDTALRLESFFHVPASFWMYLQMEYDLQEARPHLKISTHEIERFWSSGEVEFHE